MILKNPTVTSSPLGPLRKGDVCRRHNDRKHGEKTVKIQHRDELTRDGAVAQMFRESPN